MILLALVIGIFLINIYLGYKNGFVKVAFMLVAWFLGIAASYVATPYVADAIIENTDLDENIQVAITAQIMETAGDIKVEELESLPEELQDIILGDYENAEDMLQSNILEVIDVDGITETIIYVISIVLVIVIVRLAMFLIEKFAVNLSKIPLVGPLNRLLGIVAGAGKGLLWSWVLLALVTVATLTGYNTTWIEQVNSSEILSWLYTNNIIVNVIVSLL